MDDGRAVSECSMPRSSSLDYDSASHSKFNPVTPASVPPVSPAETALFRAFVFFHTNYRRYLSEIVESVRASQPRSASPQSTEDLMQRGTGATGKLLELQSTGRGFKSYSGQRCVTTLGKLLTPMCLCHQAL